MASHRRYIVRPINRSAQTSKSSCQQTNPSKANTRSKSAAPIQVPSAFDSLEFRSWTDPSSRPRVGSGRLGDHAGNPGSQRKQFPDGRRDEICAYATSRRID
ncbi:uncharacterized protein EI97DRAFT_114357 [Westerdykella ornata]|uniref:Uncharacterized protein n=1 Tax=Westerdykella ornata TaxID=318751 RepID=A0A6A6JVD0_WESOR|nr:uncharacterized protein EI97DRAFT_114357 [Westerdykella ornata]KAF2280195.1 hypothetical protein EI97DRAFT_114357 [Westerdykella ornata]